MNGNEPRALHLALGENENKTRVAVSHTETETEFSYIGDIGGVIKCTLGRRSGRRCGAPRGVPGPRCD